MLKIIEDLKKDRLPVHPKCRCEQLSEEESDMVVKGMLRCSRVEPVEQIIDEATGLATRNYVDTACRCTTYVNPSYWWERGLCPMADHMKIQPKVVAGKVRAGQQKQKKKK